MSWMSSSNSDSVIGERTGSWVRIIFENTPCADGTFVGSSVVAMVGRAEGIKDGILVGIDVT